MNISGPTLDKSTKIFSHTFPSSIFLAEFTVSATDILKANGGEGSAAGNMCRLKTKLKMLFGWVFVMCRPHDLCDLSGEFCILVHKLIEAPPCTGENDTTSHKYSPNIEQPP